MDYQDIYKRGLAAGMDKGTQSARDQIKDEVSKIVDSQNNNHMKLNDILKYLQIDKEVEPDGIERNGTSGDNEQNQGNE